MEYGARNKIKGKVTEIKKGDVMCEVTVELPGGGVMTSVMTISSMEEMALKEGDQVKVVVKAVNALLVKE